MAYSKEVYIYSWHFSFCGMAPKRTNHYNLLISRKLKKMSKVSYFSRLKWSQEMQRKCPLTLIGLPMVGLNSKAIQVFILTPFLSYIILPTITQRIKNYLFLWILIDKCLIGNALYKTLSAECKSLKAQIWTSLHYHWNL